eukprot:34122_1
MIKYKLIKSLQKQINNKENDSKQNDIPKKQPPKQVTFKVGQKVQAKDGRWEDAIIKQVGINMYGQSCVRVGWLLEKWAREGYDKIWKEDEWKRKNRDPITH